MLSVPGPDFFDCECFQFFQAVLLGLFISFTNACPSATSSTSLIFSASSSKAGASFSLSE